MSNEITVRITCSIQEMYNIIEKKGFSIIDKYNLEDIYYIKKDVELEKFTAREILNRCVLIRNITQFKPNKFTDSYNIYKLTFKNKNIALNGEIISQEKTECEIHNIEDGKRFIESLEYKELMTIKEKNIVYEKDGLELAIKDIEGIDTLIEVETIDNNKDFNTTDKLKEKINELQIPIDTKDYFVKKAEIKLTKLLSGE